MLLLLLDVLQVLFVVILSFLANTIPSIAPDKHCNAYNFDCICIVDDTGIDSFVVGIISISLLISVPGTQETVSVKA
jgi:hypothetical protein